jgi:hypothetical protein
MSIRQRLAVLAIQLSLIATVTMSQEGRPYSSDPLFLTLVGLAITPMLEEPRFRTPTALLVGSLEGLLLVLIVDKDRAFVGWVVLGGLLLLSALIATVALVTGAGRLRGRFVGLGRAATQLSKVLTARVVLSLLFAMLVIEERGTTAALDGRFWWPVCTWLAVIALSRIPWLGMFKELTREAPTAKGEGMVGPSRLTLSSADDIPAPGVWVTLEGRGIEVDGVVVNRIARPNDVWGEIHVVDSRKCEQLLSADWIRIRKSNVEGQPLHGSVDVGSTQSALRFQTTGPLAVGRVVRVPVGGEMPDVLYQVASAAVEQSNVKDGAQLVVRATAVQIGFFDVASARLLRHRWVPPPGAAVFGDTGVQPNLENVPTTWLRLGNVVGTHIPVFLDLELAADGHLAILGMTRMGKSTLALRVATAFGAHRRVVVLDQTGEYKGRVKLPTYKDETDWQSDGVCVCEPPPGKVPMPTFALEFLRGVMRAAFKEYQDAEGKVTRPRTVLIDEAHQFVPEPTSLQYDSREVDTGRNSAYQLGVLVMQVRKYGLSMILVSQRTAVVAKSALSQCENLIAFRSVDHTGIDYLEAIAGEGVKTLVPNLGHAEALVFGPAITAENPVAISIER